MTNKSMACPICKKLFLFENLDNQPSFPFCSDRCKLIDLGRWIDGSYLITRELNEDELDQFEELIEEKAREMGLDE
ncbi:MAG: DNA gyrase inhibitor YacG [Planctomycetota bacterium]|nr:DNA gyrase inhibitor YacG [Planctomycetota bacterium]RLT13609.1 MAG: DNA gyrase inhibitor YacG [Planctomycetota bacterium]